MNCVKTWRCRIAQLLSRLISLSSPIGFVFAANPNKLFPYLARNYPTLLSMANTAGLASLSRHTGKALCSTYEAIRGALDSPPPIGDMRADHRRAHVHVGVKGLKWVNSSRQLSPDAAAS